MAFALRPSVTHDNSDLTPPEVRRVRQICRRVLLASPFIVGFLVALVLAAPPAARAIKGWHSRRLAQQAFILIGEERWNEAASKARDAYQLSFNEPEAWRAIARVLSRSEQSATALEWWEKIANANQLSLQDRRDFAAAALSAGDVTAAEKQINVLLTQEGRPAPADILLNSQLAARRGDTVAALDGVQQAAAHTGIRPRDLLDSAVLVFSIAPSDSPNYADAWGRLAASTRDPANPVSLEALVLLARQPPPAATGSKSNQMNFSSGFTGVASMSTEEIAAALQKHPKARPYHRMLALQLRAQKDPGRESGYVAQAVQQFAGGDDDGLAALAAWLQARRRYQMVLQVLPVDRALQRRDLFLQHLDALAMLGRWQDIAQLLTSERFPLDEVSHHMYLASARTHTGELTAAANEWQRALEATDTPEKCLALAAYAERGSAWPIADAAYVHALQLTPHNRSAYLGRLRVAEASGQTSKAATVAAEIVQQWPYDTGARDEEAYLRLLLGTSGPTIETTLRQAETFALREPWNWNARKTQALACLRLGRISAALDAFSDRTLTGLEPPGALAVRAAALAANGWKEAATIAAKNLAAASLLPEERTLIAPLLRDKSEEENQPKASR